MANIDKYYKDIDAGFRRAWNSDVADVTGYKAVRNSLVGIITTRRGSRPFYPEFGCDLANLLFDNFTPDVGERAKNYIIQAVKNFEPRVSDIEVDVKVAFDQHTLSITLFYEIIDNPDEIYELKLHANPDKIAVI